MPGYRISPGRVTVRRQRNDPKGLLTKIAANRYSVVPAPSTPTRDNAMTSGPQPRGRRLALLLAVALSLSGCDVTGPDDATRLTFEGRVTAANGAPVAGATVALEAATFVWQSGVASDTTDADGSYRIEYASALCAPGQSLRSEERLTSWMLTVNASGYRSLSSVNIGRELMCVRAVQRVDFVLTLI